MIKNKRIDWIDVIKGLAMFIVIFGHTFPSNNGLIRKYIYSFHMPLFFLISGFTAKKDLTLDFRSFVIKKINNLLIPYFIINIVSILFVYILTKIGVLDSVPMLEYLVGTFYGCTDVYQMINGPTWFILSLFIVEVLFYLINKVSKNNKEIFIFSIICAIISYVNSISTFQVRLPWHINSSLTGVFFYCIGFLFISYCDKFSKIIDSKRNSLIVGFILGVIGLVTSILNIRTSMYSEIYGSFIIYYISSLSSIFAIILFVKLFLKKSVLFKTIGKYSLFYLSYHLYLIEFMEKYFSFFTNNTLMLLVLSICVVFLLFPFALLAYKYFPIVIGKSKLIRIKNCDKINVHVRE